MLRKITTLLGLAILTGAGAAAAATVDVGIVGTGFSPATVNIQVGDTVRWTNNTGTFHDVKADDNSFGNTASASWTFTHTFSAPGTFGYFCSIHGFPGGGMAGTVTVSGGGGNAQPGTLRFSQASYSVNENAGTATITVQRIDGDDGAVSVHYAATAGTATAGADFTATSGTLSWADNDDGSKSFTVTVLNDGLVESNETVQLQLSDPTGDAAIDPTRQNATLQIVDHDVPTGGNPPAAPTNLQAAAQSTTSIALTWTDNANNETGFRIESRTVDSATFTEVMSVGANVTNAVVPGLTPSTFYLFRVRAVGSGGFSGYSNQASATTDGVVGPCVPGTETLCLNNGRFRTEVAWRTADNTGHGQAVTIPTAPDSGLFYFFGSANIELLVKVLNACFFNRYWVFYSATTNVEFAVTVTDTQNGKVKSYYNPLNQAAAPVQDTDAFATCP
jgi:plastocyanin